MTTTQQTTTPVIRELKDVKIERFQRNLRVPLTDKEMAQRAQRAAHLLSERDHKDAEQKAAAKHAKAQIAEVEAELRRVSGEISDGATYREVSCERRHNYRLGAIEEVRLDTNEVIAERAMTDRERQLDLDLPIENGKSNGAGNDVIGPEESFADGDVEEEEDDDPFANFDDADDDEEDTQDEEPPPEPALATQKKKAKRATRSRRK